jgi:caa(3)-type oxidase subunit IV
MSQEHAEHTHHPDYVKIWAILCVLLAISVAGPFLGIKAVTLITAFGIAVVKAYMVAKNFMHITFAKRFVTYLVVTCLVFMLLFFAGVAPDVMRHQGWHWEKPSWNAETQAYRAEAAGGAPEHGGEHP